MYNMQAEFRPYFEGKIEVHMHNTHPCFHGDLYCVKWGVKLCSNQPTTNFTVQRSNHKQVLDFISTS